MGHGKTLSSSLIGVGASEGLEQSSDVIRFKFKRSLWPEDWPEKRRDLQNLRRDIYVGWDQGTSNRDGETWVNHEHTLRHPAFSLVALTAAVNKQLTVHCVIIYCLSLQY